MTAPPPLPDHEVAELAHAFMCDIHAYYKSKDIKKPSAERVFVVMNALAIATATAVGPISNKAREWFDRALTECINDLRSDPEWQQYGEDNDRSTTLWKG